MVHNANFDKTTYAFKPHQKRYFHISSVLCKYHCVWWIWQSLTTIGVCQSTMILAYCTKAQPQWFFLCTNNGNSFIMPGHISFPWSVQKEKTNKMGTKANFCFMSGVFPDYSFSMFGTQLRGHRWFLLFGAVWLTHSTTVSTKIPWLTLIVSAIKLCKH